MVVCAGIVRAFYMTVDVRLVDPKEGAGSAAVFACWRGVEGVLRAPHYISRTRVTGGMNL
jgi:hypothetical protein